jgi:phospholipase/carboxylesterase
MLSGHERKPLSGKAKQLVVILHGWGADGANLIDLADAWAKTLPDAHFCAPNAHEVCEVNPYGFQWFSLMDRSPARMQSGVANAAKHVNEFLDAKLKELGAQKMQEPVGEPALSLRSIVSCDVQQNIAETIKLALVGFSQGTMTALHMGLRRADVSCVLGYSGSLLEDEASLSALFSIGQQTDSALSTLHGASSRRAPEALKISLIHGEQDDVVPFASMARAEQLLKAQNVPIETHARPRLTHSIDMEGVAIGGKFLARNLA